MAHALFMTGAILAGGLGTRFSAVLPGTAKTIAPVQGRPFVVFPLEQMIRGGVSPIVICTGHLADQVRLTLGDRYAGVPMIYSEETTPLGTGGAVREAWKRHGRQDPWIIVNGDSWLDFDAREMLEFHRRRQAAVTIATALADDGSRFGELEWDAQARVTAFREKTGSPTAKWINAGIYIMDAAFLNALPESTPLSLENQVFPKWLDGRMSAFACTGRFIDIGTPDSYQQAQSFFEAAKA